MIPEELYKKIVDTMPILCVDLVIKNGRGEFLLVKRKNQPLKGEWFVPGGRMMKGETVTEAVIRKAKEELGVMVIETYPIGIFEFYFKENPFCLESGVSGLSIVNIVNIFSNKITLDNQSCAWKYSEKLPEIFEIKSFSNYRW